ncbi:hypothetical protein BDK51DRAFT_31378, partial [Blyttiomyces helicus]
HQLIFRVMVQVKGISDTEATDVCLQTESGRLLPAWALSEQSTRRCSVLLPGWAGNAAKAQNVLIGWYQDLTALRYAGDVAGTVGVGKDDNDRGANRGSYSTGSRSSSVYLLVVLLVAGDTPANVDGGKHQQRAKGQLKVELQHRVKALDEEAMSELRDEKRHEQVVGACQHRDQVNSGTH